MVFAAIEASRTNQTVDVAAMVAEATAQVSVAAVGRGT